MIEIQAKLVRDKTAVFLAGETVECFVTFTNVKTKPLKKVSGQGPDDINESLAWATVLTQCCCNASYIKNGESSADFLSSTSLGRQNNLIVATQPKFLFCDLVLEPGESKSYLYKEDLPKNGPPTYRGVQVKFFYRINIATQRVGSKVQTLSVPIRVLPFCLTEDESLTMFCDDTNDDIAPPANPFIEKKRTESYLEVLLHYLQNLTSRRCPSFYIITNKRGRVGRFCLFKSNYKIGEDIVGTLDFSTQTVKCVQYSVALQLEEVVKKTGKTTITTFNKHHEVCLGLLETQMILPIPLHVTPSFNTEEVDVNWRLHFQFVTSVTPSIEVNYEPGETWMAPTNIDIETLVWNLGIKILPTNPLQISQPSGIHTLQIK